VKRGDIIMTVLYIIISAILFYFVIRYGIRDGMVETEANKDKLIHMQKSNDLFGDISRIYFNLPRSKNEKNLEEAKKIYDDSLDMILSENDSKDIFAVLTKNKEKISVLDNQN